MSNDMNKDFSKESLKVVTVEPIQAALKQGYGVTKLAPTIK